MDYRSTFIYWYFNQFQLTELYQNMATMAEESPWHRERNIATHTDMVVSSYVAFAPEEWTYEDLLGGFACAFHDVGKPAACEKNGIKWKEERGHYKSFGGHEQISARLWENWAVENYQTLINDFLFTPYDIYRVGWIIEKHLPWGIKRADKRHNIALTSLELFSENGPRAYTNMLLADTYGRMSDDYVEKRAKVHAWIDEFNQLVEGVMAADNYRNAKTFKGRLYVLIGASGSGKTSYIKTFSNADVFSLDALRMEWYVEGKKIPTAEQSYDIAFRESCKDKCFKSNANQRFLEMIRSGNDIIVDNVNASKKSRRWYITEARKHGYKIVAVTFPVALQTVLDRQHSRPDKTVPDEAVRRQYMSISAPDYGEFDDVIVSTTNL